MGAIHVTAIIDNKIELDNKQPIDPDSHSPEWVSVLMKDTQGNIIRAHGRDRSRHLFVRFGSNVTGAKKWLAAVGSAWVTSAMEQWQQSRARDREIAVATAIPEPRKEAETLAAIDQNSKLFVNVMLTAKAYEALGVKKAMPKGDPSFQLGARHEKTRDKLNDPPLDEWDQDFNQQFHVLVIVAHDNEHALKNAAQQVVDSVREFDAGTVVHEEIGHVLRRAPDKGEAKGPVIEHFGFRDSVSNPLFFKKDIVEANEEKDRGGTTDPRYSDPFASLNLALLPDPGAKEGGCGSYFVYRKLRQDVLGFKDDLEVLAKRLRAAAEIPRETLDYYRDLAGAYIFGRFADGTPVTERSAPGLGAVNKFDYGNDAYGTKCPFVSHARKTNPRGDMKNVKQGSLEDERSRRIVRRAINYGPHTLNPKKTDDVGLLFLCAQSSIERQFEFMRHIWCDQKDFPVVDTGMDPTIGHSRDDDEQFQTWPRKYGQTTRENSIKDFSIGPWVTLRGAEYFFVPSLSFLRSLHSGGS
jgi:deferrochelatase/peroxidase EfeB